MQSLPGRYGLDGSHFDTQRQHLALVSEKGAKEAGIRLHGSQEAMEVHRLMPAAARFVRMKYRGRNAGIRHFLWLQERTRMQDAGVDYSHGPQCFLPWTYRTGLLSGNSQAKGALTDRQTVTNEEIGKQFTQNVNTLLTMSSASGPNTWWRL